MAGLIAACSFGTYSGDVNPPPGPAGTSQGDEDAGLPQLSDLPCEVAAILQSECLGCHGPIPANGAQDRLDSLAALRAPSRSDPSKSYAQFALERMQSATSPMPPAPYARATSTQIEQWSTWVSGGTQAGSCVPDGQDGGLPPVGDGGAGSSSDSGVSGDLPCGVAQTLGTYCTLCHGSPPSNGAPFSLNSRSALMSISPTYAGQTLGARSVTRMESTTQPMPPAPYASVPAANLTDFSSWVSSGMPAGSCNAPGDGGVPPVQDGGVDAGTPDAGLSGDFPCDVADVLMTSCTSCHGSPPSGGAPMALTTLAQLRATSPSNAAVTNGEACMNRMASTTAPMPPLPAAPVAQAKQTAFASWVSSGMPAGSCAVDAGTPDPVFNGPPTCTSGTYWTGGDQESPEMHPGLACIACHSRGEGPAFSIAGTAYPTGHEYDDCSGTASQGAVVTVTDSNGVTRSFTANRAGNFYGSATSGWPAFPITAKITFGGKTRTMNGGVSSGDCNACHTLQGASGAPGRVALP